MKKFGMSGAEAVCCGLWVEKFFEVKRNISIQALIIEERDFEMNHDGDGKLVHTFAVSLR